MDKFKILSIDGGGIKGVFPAKFLTSLEEEIGEGQIHKHFDLICGTSTGGIIALALSLGIPAKEILKLYQKNAKTIFGSKSYNFFTKPFYKNEPLEKLIKDIFIKYHLKNEDPRIIDAKVKLLIPTYSLIDGATQVLKTPHTTDLLIDKHVPMYMAAMATAAAPTYFNAYSNTFKRIDSDTVETFSNKVDGGIYANNPSMIGIIEATTRLEKELSDIQLLSIGTGQLKYSEAKNKKLWSVWYWLWISKKRIFELFMQSQSQLTHNSISILSQFNEDFLYKRIDLDFDHNFHVNMDETNANKLDKLAEIGTRKFQNEGKYVLDTFCSSSISVA
ncbi:CBASS cGAMP-activated phospholipase [Hwangdonia lutea]|uniref:CBASS cGAMP-activated phospholipase n=1 Tax=Hwangdonia lutea TaxID=3075823 RepID=A0AA97EQD2_9FLAO|nr:CBASS cGAMP-activated phospholipase [Hwangdonia sp. SCSIO 19198]WOD44183.1 CBASS cGAMP-activated phospholipase [Hwangdonia sp. SCSIO 19198]